MIKQFTIDQTEGNRLNIETIKKTINDIASIQKISKWDLGASATTETSVQIDHGESKQLKASQRTSITIRVWNEDGLIGITSTSDLTEPGLIRAMKGAQTASVLGNPNESPDFSPLSKAFIPTKENTIHPQKGVKALLSSLREAEADLLNRHQAITSVPYNGIGESQMERIYMNSDGAMRHHEISHSSIYLYALTQENSKKPRSGGAIRISKGFDTLDLAGCIDEAALKTISHLNYKPIETGTYLICFTPEAFLEILGAFSNMFNARSVLDGISISNKDSIGQSISVPFLSIFDNPHHPSNILVNPFDGEGTPTKDLCLVRSGILENFIHSQATAKVFNVNPTGHAGLGAKVSVGLEWLEVRGDSSHSSNDQSLNHSHTRSEFVLIESLNALHSGVKASQGSFSLPFDGWLVRDGEMVSIEAATIAGDIKELLSNIISVENDQKFTHHGISPHVWVGGLKVTGEA